MRLGSNVVVKYGTTVNPSEGETMKYVSQHCNIRIPKVLAIFSDYDIHLGKEVKEHFIVMELIPGQTLESAWTSLTLDERIEIGEQVRVALVGDAVPVISAVYMVNPGEAWQLYRIR